MTRSFIRKHLKQWKAYVPGEHPQALHAPQTTASAPQHFIKLNTNENPFPPEKLTAQLQALLKEQSLTQLALNRYPDPSAKRLRTLASTTLAIPYEYLVFANGSDELLAAIFRAYLEPNTTPAEKVTLLNPSYNAYHTYSGLYNIPVETIELGSNFLLTADDLSATQGKVVFLANPHAPSGALLPQTTLEHIIARYPTKLFVIDEAYADFANVSLVQAVATYPNLIIIKTLSKAYALAGMRLGYAICQPQHATILRKVLDPYNVNILTQELAILALKERALFQAQIKTILTLRKYLLSQLHLLGFTTVPSHANFLLTAPTHFSLHDETTAVTTPLTCTNPIVSERAFKIYHRLKEQGILVRYFPSPRLKAYIRISIGSGSELEHLLQALRILKKT